MLELAILGLLKEHPMHGYQLSRELSDAHGPFWRVSYGSLYPSLRRLERDGAIEATAPDGAGGRNAARSMTEDTRATAKTTTKKTTKGRRKTVYRITSAGEDLFLDLLQEAPHEGQSEDTRFRIRLAFFRYLSPEARIRLMERRRSALQERLAAITDALRSTTTRDDYQRSLMEHSRLATESDIAWLTGLIQAERSKTTTGTPRYRGSERRATATLRRKERTG